MLRRLIVLILRVFFRRLEITGAEHVPASGPVLFVLNHPNSLVDPLFLLGLAPRRVVFLAKAPLFRIPVIGRLVKAVGSIPVHRRQDRDANMAANRATFERVRAELDRGGAVALFPEGVSHDDPVLRPLKTGAARMAIGAASVASGAPVRIVPAGLYYTAKATFRSSALVSFGEPIVVRPETLDADGEPPPAPVHALTDELREALDRVTLQAGQQDALALVARAERIFSSAIEQEEHPDLARRFALRRRFLEGYTWLRAHRPERLARLERDFSRYEARLAAAGLAPESLTAAPLRPGRIVAATLAMIGFFVVVFPVALVGIGVHLLPYQLIGPFARRTPTGAADLIATRKILASCVVFPACWIVVGWMVGRQFGWPIGLGTAVAVALSGWVAVIFLERLDRFIGAARGFALLLLRPRAFARLQAERRRLRDEVLALNEMLPA
jgi:1-acyl-sn-glycerol-3-phosphate acyltransferase